MHGLTHVLHALQDPPSLASSRSKVRREGEQLHEPLVWICRNMNTQTGVQIRVVAADRAGI
jgi:hypothetical protein